MLLYITHDVKWAIFIFQVILTVEVTDGDNEDTTTVDIAIKDINDQSPIFEREIYEATIPEDSPVGMPVEQLKATDADIGANALVTYRIQVLLFEDKNEFS